MSERKPPWLAFINLINLYSVRSCPKTSTGSRFRRFPPRARLAVLVGHPAEAGPYVVRVKVPDGTKLMPHKHPEDRIYTVMSGVFYIGLGETFRRRQGEGLSAWQCDRSARRDLAFSLG